MTDFYPAHGDEVCPRCGDEIITWYCVLPLGPNIDEVVCPGCFFLEEVPT